MTKNTFALIPAVLLLAADGSHSIQAATPIPSWEGEHGTTRQLYEFTTNNLNPTPEYLQDPGQAPSANITLGEWSEGWQDPSSAYDNTGVNEDGAWDIGQSGSINVQVPVAPSAPPTGQTYRVDFEVYAVAYLGISSLPGFDDLGISANDLTLTQSTVAPDPEFPGATWQGLLWTGYYENVTNPNVPFSISAPASNISVVDTFQISTRVTLIPEPSGTLLILSAIMLGALRRRRS